MLNTPIHHAAIGITASGDNVIVAASSGNVIRILSCLLIVKAAESLYFKDATSGNDIIGTSTVPIYQDASGGFMLPFSPEGHGDTAIGEALEINLATGEDVAGYIKYTLI